jgi:uncharacterized protein
MTRQNSLVVSIHDVAPPVWQQVKEILAQLHGAGVERVSLLVVPDYRAESRIDQYPAFCEWLQARQHAGDELVLHGYEHVEVKPPQGLADRIKNRVYTVGEGEFLCLPYSEARDRLERGLDIFRNAGIQSTGFVAPSWLLGKEGLAATRDLGFQYTNTYLQFSDLTLGRTTFAPSLVFGPGNFNEDWALRAQRLMGRLMRRCSIVRAVIHPPCIEDAGRFSQTLRLIAEQLTYRPAITYQEFLNAWRERESTTNHERSHGLV